MLNNRLVMFLRDGYEKLGSLGANAFASHKAELYKVLGVTTLIRGRDIEEDELTKEADAKLGQVLAEVGKQLVVAYHPTIMSGGLKIGTSDGACESLQLHSLLGEMPQGLDSGHIRPYVYKRLLVPLVYTVALLMDKMPLDWAAVLDYHKQFDLQEFCQRPNIEFDCQVWRDCIDFVAETEIAK